MSTDFNDLFNPKGAVPQEQKKAINEFKPDPKKTQNGVYSAIIRFVVYHANPSKSIMSKLTAWVENPLTQSGMYVDDPRSGGAQDSPVSKMYWSLINTKRANLEDLAKKCLSTRQNYASLVQVVQDPQHPENVGKILVYRYSTKIYNKLINEQTPPMQGMVGYNPFDPITGRYFSMKVTIQGGFPNYDQCQFIDYRGANGETSGVWFDNTVTGQKEICTESSDKTMFYNYLIQNSPDLSKYDYQPWTPQIQEHVDTVLKLIGTYVTTGSYGQNIAAAQPTSIVNPAPAVAPAAIPGMNPITPTPAPASAVTGISFGGASIPGMNPITPAPAVTPITPASAPSIAPVMESNPAPAAPATPSITGLDIPDVASALPKIEPVGAPQMGGSAPMFGDLSSVLSSM